MKFTQSFSKSSFYHLTINSLIVITALLNVQTLYAHNKVVVIPLFGDDAPAGPFTPVALESTDTGGYTSGNYTTIDKASTLEWQKSDNGVQMNWHDAIYYCFSLVLDGKTNWRLPNRSELHSIIYYGSFSPAINGIFFPATKSAQYWTSSVNPRYTREALNINFDTGRSIRRSQETEYYVRCVR